MADCLFSGAARAPRGYALGLAYLREQLDKRNTAALLLVGNRVPLDVAVTLQVTTHLRTAADLGSRVAMLKWGTLMALRSESRDAGIRLIERSRISVVYDLGLRQHDPRAISSFLKALPPEVADGFELALLEARSALNAGDLERACSFIVVASHIIPASRKLAQTVWSAVEFAATTQASLDLPVELVECSLNFCSTNGDPEAQYGLGCALAGIPYRQLAPHHIVRSGNADKAATLFLSAADAGRRDAWLNLSELLASGRSGKTRKGMARFFLEKAAQAGVVQAQARLGAALLKEARSLESAEAAIRWLTMAAEESSVTARELLATLVLPIPALAPDHESSILQKIAELDFELGARATLARVLHLTKREAMNFSARDIRPWGLLIPGASYENPKGRLAPAASREAKSELRRIAALFGGTRESAEGSFIQRSRALRRVFRQLGVCEKSFFSDELGRSLTHFGYGRHWACRADTILKRLVER